VHGFIGGESSAEKHDPIVVPGADKDVVAVTSGGIFSCALTSAGGVKCWGGNELGELGTGTIQDESIASDVKGLRGGVIEVAAGYFHACALTSQRGVKCWGYNRFGQLGDGTKSDSIEPVQVVGLSSGVRAIYAGGNHTCAAMIDDMLKCWGYNKFGQLGNGTYVDTTVPKDVIGLAEHIQTVSAGANHTCALTISAELRCWGSNDGGQLGNGIGEASNVPNAVIGLTNDIIDVSSGAAHTCVVSKSGNVKCWGINDMGQLGDGTFADSNSPVDVVGLQLSPK
jgi:alpha-tubulin suppressor-like RCC1 family protein